eukprot:5037075-Karenia_brevis.AAC.1
MLDTHRMSPHASAQTARRRKGPQGASNLNQDGPRHSRMTPRPPTPARHAIAPTRSGMTGIRPS